MPSVRPWRLGTWARGLQAVRAGLGASSAASSALPSRRLVGAWRLQLLAGIHRGRRGWLGM
jgi:hypothetical protein